MVEPSSRWFCRTCGIVSDVPHGPGYPGLPFCHHNARDVMAARMVPIPSYHPLNPARQGPPKQERSVG